MRQHVGLETLDRARPLPAAVRLDAELDAALEQDLHADADAQDRASARESLADDPVTADRQQSLHARRERSDAGNHQSVGSERHLRVGGHLDLGAGASEGALRRVEISGAVVERATLRAVMRKLYRCAGPAPRTARAIGATTSATTDDSANTAG